MSEQFGSMFSGAAMAGLAGYALISFAITGPIVLERKINLQEDWPRVCREEIMKNNRPTASRGGSEIQMAALACQFMPPGHFKIMCVRTAEQAIRAKQAQVEAAKQAVMAAAVSESETRCGCSRAQVQKALAIPAAIHSASWTMITGPRISSLKTELKTALHSPQCRMKG